MALEETGADYTRLMELKAERINVQHPLADGSQAVFDFGRNVVSGGLLDIVNAEGVLTPEKHAGRLVVATGHVVIEQEPGFVVFIRMNGAYKIQFDGLSHGPLETNDLVTAIVENSSTIHAYKFAAASRLSFS